MRTDPRTTIMTGATVYDADGEKIGTVAEVVGAGPGGYLELTTGFLGLGAALYPPLDAVAAVRDDGVHLAVRGDDALGLGWDAPPTGAGTGGVETVGTAPVAPPAGPVEHRPVAPERAPRTAAADDRTLELREEELRVTKERVRTGEVEIGKRIVEERRTMDVPVTREEVVIERRPVNQPSDEPIGADARAIEVPVMAERVSVEKQTVVTEEIGVSTRRQEGTEHVSETVRHEEAVVGPEGDAVVRGAGAPEAPATPRHRRGPSEPARSATRPQSGDER
jgi:uncharacterized protein (TIGR02271 family)